MSDGDVDDFADSGAAGDHEYNRDPQGDQSRRSVEQWMGIGRVDQRDDQKQAGWQTGQDESGQAP